MRIMIVALLVAGSALPALAQDVSGAQDASAKFTTALGKADAATAASFLTDDAVALPPGRGPLNGKAEIQRFLGNMTRSVKELKYVQEEVKPINDSTAREIGTFSFKMQNGKAQDVSGKYLLIWTKVGGDWKIAADMWNRSSMGGGGQGGGGQGGGNGNRRGGAMKGDTEAE